MVTGWNAPKGVENVHTLCAGKPESVDRGNDVYCIRRIINVSYYYYLSLLFIILSSWTCHSITKTISRIGRRRPRSEPCWRSRDGTSTTERRREAGRKVQRDTRRRRRRGRRRRAKWRRTFMLTANQIQPQAPSISSRKGLLGPHGVFHLFGLFSKFGVTLPTPCRVCLW